MKFQHPTAALLINIDFFLFFNWISEKKALYLFANEDKDVYEIKKFTEEYRSWFIGNSVQSGELPDINPLPIDNF